MVVVGCRGRSRAVKTGRPILRLGSGGRQLIGGALRRRLWHRAKFVHDQLSKSLIPLNQTNSIDAKDVQIVGSAERDFGNLPDQIRKEAITALSDLQNGRIPKSGRYKELTDNDKLRGVGEIRLNGDDGNTYRVYNVICLREVIYVLDAGVKKSVARSRSRMSSG
jgi:phage-related protein